jgi:hypothetical protein
MNTLLKAWRLPLKAAQHTHLAVTAAKKSQKYLYRVPFFLLPATAAAFSTFFEETF